MTQKVKRCAWAEGVSLEYIRYHDVEWGVPVTDDRTQFEFLILEGAQAGLSWSTILKKREGYRKAFDNFNPSVVATYSQSKISELLLNPDIVRNKLKVNSAVTNAQAFLQIQEEFGSFDAYIWRFTDGKPIQNRWQRALDVPTSTPESDAMGKDLKKRGFKFVGTTICYAFMQAVGMVNDHTTDCFRYGALCESDMPDEIRFPVPPEKCHSLLKKHLTKELFDNLKEKKTSNGVTLADIIRSGVENPDSSVGIYAGDAESYTLFAPFLDPVIADYHAIEKGYTHKRAFQEEAPLPELTALSISKIISTRIRVGRNLEGFPLGPAISAEGRSLVERQIRSAVETLDGDLEGEYLPLSGMNSETKQHLTEAHLLFKEGDRFLQSAGLTREWPEGRGLYLSRDKAFSVWVNEEDQLRIIALEKGGELLSVLNRLKKGVKALEKKLPFIFTPHLGYITSCPTNLGTAMRASVHIKLPNLSLHEEKMKQTAAQHGLQVRGLYGEHTRSEAGIFDLSIKRRLGITEAQAIEGLVNGINALSELEEK